MWRVILSSGLGLALMRITIGSERNQITWATDCDETRSKAEAAESADIRIWRTGNTPKKLSSAQARRGEAWPRFLKVKRGMIDDS